MQRRGTLLALAAAISAGAIGDARADGEGGVDDDAAEPGNLDDALRRFRALPGTKAYLVQAGIGGSVARLAHQPEAVLFIASAFKTFVLGQYLRDVESGRLSEDEALAIDDGVRNFGSPVFIDLAGATPARSVLEAMITHSDNLATDAAMRKVGAARVRALIAEAGLRSTRIPDSTRRFGSYLVGAPAGVDLGWPGIVKAFENPPGPLRPLLNDVQTIAGSARDLVSWYEQALQGAFFTKKRTLVEFKRIQAMSRQIAEIVPPGTVVYAKGGEVEDFNGARAKSLAGQMIVGKTPVTFCFLVNWSSTEGDFATVQAEFFSAIAAILRGIRRELR